MNPERRFRLIFLAVMVGLLLLIGGVCATLASVAPYAIDFHYQSPTPDIPITGTITEIAGMPIPPDGVLTAQVARNRGGGTFDYMTTLRPQQVYNFYYALLTERGVWQPGRSAHIDATSANFQFFPNLVPRLTIIDVKCDSTLCNVHVDY